jgi:subtilisin family serine protease
LLSDAGLRGSAEPVVVQFGGPVSAKRRERLAAAGVTLLDYLGNHAWFARVIEGGADGVALAAVPSLIDARTLEPDWKLHPALTSGETPDWAIVPVPTGAVAAQASETWVAVYVLFFEDVAAGEARPLVESLGAVVRTELQTVNGFVIEMPTPMLAPLAGLDAVMYVEPALPPLEPTNAENRSLTGADIAQASPYNLDGWGVTVMVYDGGGVSETHQDLAGRVTIMDGANPGVHATHVGGTIAGDGKASSGVNRGMAPAATLLSYSAQYPVPQGFPLYTDPGDLEGDFADAMAHGAVLGNASLALNTSVNAAYVGCDILGDYSVTSGVIDAVVRGGLGAPFLSVWGVGNERSEAACGTTYAKIPPPHAAKNHITVGAVNANDDSMTNFSSWGPVDDGRIKPDVVAPGCQVGGDGGVTSTSAYDDGDYFTLCGTSMASPTVTGLAALLIQDFRAQYPGRVLFRNATLKAVLAHTAVDRGNPGPDYQFGYGSVRIQPAIDLMRSGAFREDSLTQGMLFSETVTVGPGHPELKTTLAWDDYPATPNVVPSLVNDLDLVVTSPTGVRHYPWTLDPANPATPAVWTQEDHVNNIEQVWVENPEPGDWTIEVYAYNVPKGPQPFSLVGDGVSQTGLSIDFPAGVPEALPPGVPTTVDVRITALGETIVADSPTLHYRYDGGTFQTTPLQAVGGDVYEGILPSPACPDVPEFYVSVEGTVSGTIRLPGDAPASVFQANVGEMMVIFEDDFETDQGWTTGAVDATAGFWERGVPIPRGVLAFGPEHDADGSGQCYLTDNSPGLSDVDGGSVTLTSPALDLSGPRSEFTFDYYLYTNQVTGEDHISAQVSVSGEAGPWIEVYRYHLPTSTPPDTFWFRGTVTSDQMAAAGATPNANTRIRLLATDGGTSSTVEGGIDAVIVSAFRCVEPTCDDGILNQGEERIDCGGPCPACPCTSDPVCDNAVFCDGAETCDAYGQCQAGEWPCSTGDWCSETATACLPHGDGDFDGDQDVDLADFLGFQRCFDQTAEVDPACGPGNLTGADGLIDLADYSMFAAELDASGP